MIYGPFGCELEVVGNCGPVTVKRHMGPIDLTLVKVRYLDSPLEARHHFAETLRADDGWQEIEAAVSGAKQVDLDDKEKRAAIKDAE